MKPDRETGCHPITSLAGPISAENGLFGHERMPVLFIGHGSPMNIMLDNEFTRSLVQLGKTLPKARAIMVISAHWLTNGTFVTCMDKPRTIHDFYGFPKELYRVTYGCPGAPEYAEIARDSVAKGPVGCDRQWGLDHGSWAVLRHIYPKADIPVFEMSIDYAYGDWNPKPIQYHYDLATGLKVLRQKGVLIIGSGNLVHNLGMVDFDIDAQPYNWALEADMRMKEKLLERNHRDLVNYQSLGREALLAVPTLDHYLPMIYAIALHESDEPIRFFHEGFQHGSISMRCFQIG